MSVGLNSRVLRTLEFGNDWKTEIKFWIQFNEITVSTRANINFRCPDAVDFRPLPAFIDSLLSSYCVFRGVLFSEVFRCKYYADAF